MNNGAPFSHLESNPRNAFHVGIEPLENGRRTSSPVTRVVAFSKRIPRAFYSDIYAAWQARETRVSIAGRYQVDRRTISKIVHRYIEEGVA